MATFQFKLPELGEGIHEGEIVKWHITPGDVIAEDQIILEVQNDKALVEVPSPVNGKVLEIKVSEGTVAIVGDVLVTFGVEGEGNQTENEKVDCAVGGGIAANVAAAKIDPVDSKHVLATPSVRKYAREKGVNLAFVPGTGKLGHITRDDVNQFASGAVAPAKTPELVTTAVSVQSPAVQATQTTVRAAAASPTVHYAVQAGEMEERVPLKGIRKAIAKAMVTSKYTAPHVTVLDEVDVTELVALRKEGKALAEEKGIKLTYLPFIVKAVVAGLKKFPMLNASIDDEKQEIIYKKYYNIGIAASTDEGLLVPVIKAANRKSVFEISSEITELATKARNRKASPDELKGSTFSITNIGSAGGMFFTPVINHPEVAILGVGRITEKPVVKNGEIVVAPVLALSLSFDHRLIDGEPAQRFVNYIKQLLENPLQLVMEG